MKVDEYLRRPYQRILQPVAGEAMVVARVKELPGCIAHGDTPQEALAALEEAMREWFETALEFGQPIPEVEEEENGQQRYSGKCLVRMGAKLHRDAAQAAAREGVSLNQHLVTLIARGLGQDEGVRRSQGVPPGERPTLWTLSQNGPLNLDLDWFREALAVHGADPHDLRELYEEQELENACHPTH